MTDRVQTLDTNYSLTIYIYIFRNTRDGCKNLIWYSVPCTSRIMSWPLVRTLWRSWIKWLLKMLPQLQRGQSGNHVLSANSRWFLLLRISMQWSVDMSFMTPASGSVGADATSFKDGAQWNAKTTFQQFSSWKKRTRWQLMLRSRLQPVRFLTLWFERP